MGDVVPLRPHVTEEVGTVSSTTPVGIDYFQTLPGSVESHKSYASTESLYDLESNEELARFISLIDVPIKNLHNCMLLLEQGRILDADTELIYARRKLPELFMFREISDSIGHVVQEAIKSAFAIEFVNQSPFLPTELAWVLTNIKSKPFMSFQNALDLTTKLETLTKETSKYGFDILTEAILLKDEEKSDREVNE